MGSGEHPRRRFLSREEMLREPHSAIPIGRLLEDYRLEIEEVTIGPFREYTPRQLLEHYNVEVELARRLREATRDERKALYATVYDELFRRIPNHPQCTRKAHAGAGGDSIRSEVTALDRYLKPETVFLEVGAGDCQLSLEVAKRVKKVYAIDVSSEILKGIHAPGNFELIVSDGSSIGVPPGSVDLAYSNQVMEHLHPEDAGLQLSGIYEALANGGAYLCTTPHRFAGPMDVSRFFDDEAKGFHLKEYTNRELWRLFRAAGFRRVTTLRKVRGRAVELTILPALMIEPVLLLLSRKAQRRLYRTFKVLLRPRLMAHRSR